MLDGWDEFAIAMAGASAALAGLIIVAMSVNLEIIVRSPPLPARAATAIGTLVLACVASCLLLVPDLPVWLYGIEVLVGTAVAWVLDGIAIGRISRTHHGSRTLKIAVGTIPLVVFTIGGGMLTAGLEAGMHAVAMGSVLGVIAGVITSWITLVEVRR